MPHAGVELLFTPKEEVGLIGAGAFDISQLEAELGFVYDQAAPIGDVIMGAPYQRSMLVRFHGRPAHSGMVPEEGRSAIAAASRAIADLRLGRIDEETTANVGLIRGGSARNIVPEWCELEAEARSHDARKLAELVQEMLDTFAFAASTAECTLETEVSETYQGYRFKDSDPIVQLAATALERCGYELVPTLTGGGADANVFNTKGLPCSRTSAAAMGRWSTASPSPSTSCATTTRSTSVVNGSCISAASSEPDAPIPSSRPSPRRGALARSRARVGGGRGARRRRAASPPPRDRRHLEFFVAAGAPGRRKRPDARSARRSEPRARAAIDGDEFVLGRGGQLATIRRTPDGYRLAHAGRRRAARRINGAELPDEGALLALGDEIEVAGTRLRYEPAV